MAAIKGRGLNLGDHPNLRTPSCCPHGKCPQCSTNVQRHCVNRALEMVSMTCLFLDTETHCSTKNSTDLSQIRMLIEKDKHFGGGACATVLSPIMFGPFYISIISVLRRRGLQEDSLNNPLPIIRKHPKPY